MISLAYLEKINSDELFYGWLLRIAKRNGYSIRRDAVDSFISDFFNMGEKSNVGKRIGMDFPYGLDNIIEQVSMEYVGNPLDVLKYHSTYAVLCRVYEYGRQALLSQIALRDRTHVINRTCKRQFLLNELQYCPVCAIEDRNNRREPYFRVWHNLPGVKICAKHNTVLKKYNFDQTEMDESAGQNTSEALQRYALFMLQSYRESEVVCLSDTQSTIKKRLRLEDMTIEDLAQLMRIKGYEQYITSVQEIRQVMKQKKVVAGKVFAILSCLFTDFNEYKEESVREKPFPWSSYRTEIADKYVQIGNEDILVELKGKHEEFWIHPYALVMGCGDPSDEKKQNSSEIINRQILKIDKGMYQCSCQPQGYEERNIVVHKVCGCTLATRLTNFIWDGRRCSCSYMTDIPKLQSQIDAQTNEYLVKKIYPDFDDCTALIVHRSETGGCGGEFSIKFTNFINNIYCRKCKSGKLHIYEKVKQILGEEYEVVYAYDWKTPVEVIHSVCKTRTYGLPNEFIHGKRCKLCTYGIHGRKSRKAGELFAEISEWCSNHSLWILKRQRTEAERDLEEALVYLVKNGYVFRIEPGVYSTKKDVLLDEYITEKYLEDNQRTIGTYYSESLLYHTGLTKIKPSCCQIMSNTSAAKKGRTSNYRNVVIRVMAPFATITNTNVSGIIGCNLIHYLSMNYQYYEDIKEYLLEKKVSFVLMRNIIGAYPMKTKLIFQRMYREVTK